MRKLTLLFSAAVLTVAAHAKIVTKPVAYEQAGVKLEGFLAYDDEKVTAGKKAPGVLVVPEWWGLTDYVKGRAKQLAQLGYVALAADMYGAGVVTGDPKKAGELAGQFYGKPLMAERAQAGLDTLLATGLVDSAHVAAIGYCFGGSTVQALAYSGAPLAGIVSFHGGLIPVPADAAGKTKAKILMCNGAADGFIKPEDLAAFTKSMNDGKFDYQFINYAGAVHAFTNPGADKVAAETGLKGIGYNEAADKRSWAHMKVFFKEILGQ
ncbi:MAG TPA: dienelactone hydrolase family protein [Candidatus Didemnitutus sp.]|nr:dienelactone hydrolase family protein [Candidatus Didemnitutus sp.]